MEDVFICQFTVLDSYFIFDFDNLYDQIVKMEKLVDTLNQTSPEFDWKPPVHPEKDSPELAKLTPPKSTYIFKANNILPLISTAILEVPLDGEMTQLEIVRAKAFVYSFNCIVLQMKISIPEKYRYNPEAIKKLSYFINSYQEKNNHNPKFSWEDALKPLADKIQSEIQNGIISAQTTTVTIPFLKITDLFSRKKWLHWRHCCITVLANQNFDMSNNFYLRSLIGFTASGIENSANNPREFAYTENHNSLFVVCKRHIDESYDEFESYVYQKWLMWMRHHEYTYHMLDCMEKVIVSVMNNIIMHLKSRTVRLDRRHVYTTDAFINYIWLATSSQDMKALDLYIDLYESGSDDIKSYVQNSRSHWGTDLLLNRVVEKQEVIKSLLHQMHEYAKEEHSNAVEKILSILGIFGFGAFLVGFDALVGFSATYGVLLGGSIDTLMIVVFGCFILRATRS